MAKKPKKQRDIRPEAQPAVRWLSVSSRERNVLVAMGLAVLLCVHVAIKVHYARELPFFEPSDGDLFYHSEAAFHFRHARMVSEGAGIPPVDVRTSSMESRATKKYVNL